MLDVIKGVGSTVKDAGAVADDLHYSGEERAAALNQRHQVDMNSDSWLSKNVRPIAFLFSLLMQAIIVIGSLYGKMDPWIVGQVGTLLLTTTGFYFQSRKAEKIASKNADTNLRIEEIKLKHTIQQERKERRLERRQRRRSSGG